MKVTKDSDSDKLADVYSICFWLKLILHSSGINIEMVNFRIQIKPNVLFDLLNAHSERSINFASFLLNNISIT